MPHAKVKLVAIVIVVPGIHNGDDEVPAAGGSLLDSYYPAHSDEMLGSEEEEPSIPIIRRRL
jgi:hypothetical protein